MAAADTGTMFASGCTAVCTTGTSTPSVHNTQVCVDVCGTRMGRRRFVRAAVRAAERIHADEQGQGGKRHGRDEAPHVGSIP